MIIGLDVFGIDAYQSYSPPVRDVYLIELKNAIYDELAIRERIDIKPENIRDDWDIDTILLAKFLGDLEAGNINNQGVQIEKFAIKRRKLNEIKPITLGYKDFFNNHQFVFYDYTQPNDEFIYSIVPVGENGLEGQENSVQIKSDFTGWALVDKDVNEIIMFDKYIGSPNNIETVLNEGRIEIETLSQYPTIYYTPKSYHTFSLRGTILPKEKDRSGQTYGDILRKFIYTRKPLLAKGSNGEVYIVNVSNVNKSAPINTWDDYDYFDLELSLIEIMSYEDYMKITE